MEASIDRLLCKGCGLMRLESEYSATQIKKNSLRKCSACTNGAILPPPPALDPSPLQNASTDSAGEPGLDGADVDLPEGATDDVDENLLKQTQTMNWMLDLLEAEKDRLKKQGAVVKPLRVQNMGVARDGKKFWNRLEIESSYDFTRVEQILVSDPVLCPHKPGYAYVHLVLIIGGRESPYLLPYIYKRNIKRNDLTQWIFINGKGARAQHQVNKFNRV